MSALPSRDQLTRFFQAKYKGDIMEVYKAWKVFAGHDASLAPYDDMINDLCTRCLETRSLPTDYDPKLSPIQPYTE